MKLRRFVARDIRQAIAKVREELGPDAVILSNRSMEDGVEIIAAMDYDESQLAQAEQMIAEGTVEDAPVSRPRKPVRKSESSYTATTRPEPVAKPEATSHEPFWKKLGSRKDVQSETENSPQYERREELEADLKHEALSWLKQLAQEENLSSPESNQLSAARPSRAAQDAKPASESKARPARQVSAAALGDKVPESLEEMQSVWGELKSLRHLLETQLSGLAWGDLAKRYPQRAKAMRHLLEMGISPAVSRRLLNELHEASDFESVWRQALRLLIERTPVLGDDFAKDGGVFALVGPTGVGKTTTIAKIAARYAVEHGTRNIAMVTTDNYRVGAQEQLRTYGRIMDIPVYVADDAKELKQILKSLYDKDLILIDTAGMSQRDMRLTEQFSMLSEGSSLIRTVLVLSAAGQLGVLDETVRAYQKTVLDACIITKLDECHTLGGALSVVSQHQLPIAYISDGQRVPEDLHRESSAALIKRAVSMMKKLNHRIEDELVEMAFGGEVANDIR